MDCQGSHACTRIDPVQEQQLSDATLHSPSSKAVALMELAVQQNGGNAHMLDRSASTEEILAAWREIRLFLHNQPSKSQQSQQQELQQQEGARQKTYATAAGILPALIQYSNSVVLSLKQIVPEVAAGHIPAKQQSAPPAVTNLDRLTTAGQLLDQLLQLWLTLCWQLSDVTLADGCKLLLETAPTVADLATRAVPILRQAARTVPVASSSSSSSSLHDQMKVIMHSAARTAAAVASAYATAICKLHEVTDQEKPEQQLETDALLVQDSLIDLLLLALAVEADQLQTSIVDPPAWTLAADNPLGCTDAAAASSSQQQQQQPQSHWRVQHQALLSSHVLLLQSLGFDRDTLTDKERNTECGSEATTSSSLSCADNNAHNANSSSGVDSPSSTKVAALGALRDLLMLRIETRRNAASSSSSSSSSSTEKQQPVPTAFPRALVMPTVKVATEIMMLLPPEDIRQHKMILELLLSLLEESAAAHRSVAAAAAIAAGKRPLPQLPPAVAAALLHPVIQILSRVVMQVLKDAPQQPDDPHYGLNLDETRAMLLFYYGCVVLIVSRPVEPKHIAAALKPDPVMPLVAIEAAIRAWATDLALPVLQQHYHRQRQQQQHDQPSSSTAAATAATTATDHGRPFVTLSHGKASPEQGHRQVAPADGVNGRLLKVLPLAWEMVQAAQQSVHGSHSCLQPLFDKYQSDQPKLLASFAAVFERVFSIALTACKLTVTAAEQYNDLCNAQEDLEVEAPGLEKMAAEGFRYEMVQLLLHGLVAVNAAAAVMQGYYTALNPDDISTYSENKQAAGGGSSSSSDLDTKRLWGLPAVMLLRLVNTLAEQCHAHHMATTEFLAVRRHSGLTDLHADMPELIVDKTARSMDVVLDMLAPVYQALVHTPLWQTTEHKRDLEGNDDHDDDDDDVKPAIDQTKQRSGSSSKEYKQRQKEWKQQQQKQLKQMQDAARDIQTQCSAFGKLSQRRGSRRDRIRSNVIEKVVQEAVALHSELQDPFCCSGTHMLLSQARSQCAHFMSSVLAGYPVPFCCNNPGCLNLSQLSEYQLVSGKGCVCGGCKVARYCSRECQKKHWKQHKQMCQQMRIVHT